MHSQNTPPKFRRAAVHLAAFIFSVILGYFLARPLMAQTPSKSSLLWKISGNGLEKPSYLFGTYHLIRDGYLPLNGKVMQAFDRVEGVVTETEIDSSQLGKVMGYTIMQSNLLSKLLDKQEFALVDQEVQQLTGQPLSAMDQFKPSTVMLFMTITYVNRLAPELIKYSGEPLDQFFITEGRKRAKTITTFETMIEQMEILYNGQSLEEQADYLVKFVRSKEEVQKFTRELVDHYLAEDLDRMQAISKHWGDDFGGLEALVDERNERWMQKLPGLMHQNSQFVAVGALHLPGKKGLIKLLRAQGYTVTPIH
ncbi:MAG: TraB/GumN family protein [Bacteroidota bacterium]